MISTLKKIIGRDRGALVLMYHRIADVSQDPWDLCVSPDNFSDQMQKLKANYDLIPMYRLAERLKEKERLTNLVAITFDDGYLDNYENAKPILEKHQVPATFYFTTKFRNEKKYWWDELEQLILNTPLLPNTATITLPGKQITLLLGDSSVLDENVSAQNARWRYGLPLSNSRLKLYFECWEAIKPMNIEEQKATLDELKRWAGSALSHTPPLMNEQQIKELSTSKLFEIGAHTVNHPALGSLSSEEQRKEITESKEHLENVVSQTLTGFAYPYGHYNSQTPVITKTSGFKYAVTTEEKPVTHKKSIYEIPRFQVKNVPGNKLLNLIKEWKKNTADE